MAILEMKHRIFYALISIPLGNKISTWAVGRPTAHFFMSIEKQGAASYDETQNRS